MSIQIISCCCTEQKFEEAGVGFYSETEYFLLCLGQ